MNQRWFIKNKKTYELMNIVNMTNTGYSVSILVKGKAQCSNTVLELSSSVYTTTDLSPCLTNIEQMLPLHWLEVQQCFRDICLIYITHHISSVCYVQRLAGVNAVSLLWTSSKPFCGPIMIYNWGYYINKLHWEFQQISDFKENIVLWLYEILLPPRTPFINNELRSKLVFLIIGIALFGM